MKQHAKAPSAGSTEAGGSARGPLRRALATRGGSGDAKGSGAPSSRRLRGGLAVLALTIAAFAFTAAPALAAPPIVTTPVISNVSYTTAHVTSELNPRGLFVSYSFEVSTDDANWTPKAGGFSFGGNGAVNADLTGLQGGTTYFVRLSAKNFSGDPEVRSPQPNPSFTTLTADPTSVISTDNASEVAYTTAKASGEIDRPVASDDVDCHFQYVTDDQFQATGFTDNPGSVPCEPENPIHTEGHVAVSANLSNLSPSTTYHLRLAVSNAANSDAKEAPSTFTMLSVDPPSVLSIDNASEVEYTQAVAKGVVERPDNADPAFDVNCNFEFVTDDQFNANPSGEEFIGATPVACNPNPVTAADTAPGTTKEVNATIPGLSPSTTYHLRLSATNLGGSDSKEAAATFTTAGPIPKPTVTKAEDATEITIHGAKVEGEIGRPAGKDPALDTSCHFEYVTDEQFTDNPPGEEFAGASRAECIEAPFYAPLTSAGPILVTAELGGLRADTTFHVRLTAENVGGTVSKDAPSTFMTLPAELPSVAIDPITEEVFTEVRISGTVDNDDPGRSAGAFIERSNDGGLTWDGISISGVVISGDPGIHVVERTYSDLQPNSTYAFRIKATYSGDPNAAEPLGEVALSPELFVTTESLAAPNVVLDPVTNITSTSAHFSGTVDTNAPAGPLTDHAKAAYKTDWHFECAPKCPPQPGLSGTISAEEGSKTISLDAIHLEPNTPYEVKLIAKNVLESGEDVQEFETPLVKPKVTALPGGSDGEGGYFLAGTVNPNNSAVTKCEFKWGPNSASYAFSAPCSPMPKGRDEVQSIGVHANGGQFKLTYRGQTTADLPFDASAAEVQAALEALPRIGSGGVAVTGAWKVTFQGSLSQTNASQIGIQDGTVPIFSTNPGGDPESKGTSTIVDGGNSAPVTVEAHLTGLNPGSVYHFKLFATNAAGTEESNPDREFTPTLASKEACPNDDLRKENNSLALPECRAYEMVTYPNKSGYLARFMRSSGGGAVLYRSTAANIVNSGQGTVINSYVATRTAAGWQTIPDLNGPIGSLTGAPYFVSAPFPEELSYSSDLLSSIYPYGGKNDPAGPHLRRPDGSFVLVGRGLTTENNPRRFVSDDLSHLVYSPSAASYATTWGGGVYEFVGTGNDQPRRVDVDNVGAQVSGCNMTNSVATANAISRDGNVIVFTVNGTDRTCANAEGSSNAPPEGDIWARVDGTTSYELSASLCTRLDCNAPARAIYQAAAKDGSRIYFTTTQQLLNSDSDQTKDLYACDIPTTPQAPVGTANPCAPLHQVSAAPGGNAEVQRVLEVTDDGSTAYFTAKGVLADNEDALGTVALPGDDNAYVWRTDAAHPDGQITFVARNAGGGQTTPDGRYLLFSTRGSLVETDTDESTDIYRYDADTQELVRVSTAVSGAGGNGDFDASLSGAAISDDGRLIGFVTDEPLSPLDGNGQPDAYLWNDGHMLGSVAPLLPGIETANPVGGSIIIDGSGQDIYIDTAARLNPSDGDFQTDVYDARIGGGFPQHQEGCVGESCQPSASNPPPTPASPANLPNGEGNVVPKRCRKGKVLKGDRCVPKHCRKGKVLKGTKCVRKPRKKHPAKKHHGKKASQKQGGGK